MLAIASAQMPWFDCGCAASSLRVARADPERPLARRHVVLHHRRGQRHHLGAAGDHEVFHPAHDLRRGEVHRGNPAAAEPVERRPARLDVIARIERRHPPEIAALLAALRRGRPDDVVDIGGIQLVSLGNRLQDGRGEMLGVHVRKRALAGLADTARGTDGVDDQCLGHIALLLHPPVRSWCLMPDCVRLRYDVTFVMGNGLSSRVLLEDGGGTTRRSGAARLVGNRLAVAEEWRAARAEASRPGAGAWCVDGKLLPSFQGLRRVSCGARGVFRRGAYRSVDRHAVRVGASAGRADPCIRGSCSRPRHGAAGLGDARLGEKRRAGGGGDPRA